MRKCIKENPVTTMFMTGFGIFLLAGYLLIVQPAKAERDKTVRDLCGETVTMNDKSAAGNEEQSNKTGYERTLLDN